MVWFIGSLCGIVSRPLAVILASVPWTCCGLACRILPWLRGHMSSWVGEGGAGSPSCGDGMFAVMICSATPACGSVISRCRIQLSWILSLCATRAVSVKGLLVPDRCALVVHWVGLRCDCGVSHYYTILMVVTSITMYYRVLPSVVHVVLYYFIYAASIVRNGWVHLPVEQTGRRIIYHPHSNSKPVETAQNCC